MRDAMLDVTLEIPLADLKSQPDPGRFLLERLRGKADELCEQSGAELRTDRAPEVIYNEGSHFVTGEVYALVASRWAALVPGSHDA